jgi:hypothetical protein
MRTTSPPPGTWPPGWYADPWGEGRRRWNGTNWTAEVTSSSQPPPPSAPPAGGRSGPPGKPGPVRRGIKWSVVGAFTVAVAVVAVQIVGGNSVCRVEIPGGANVNFAACGGTNDAAAAGEQLVVAQSELTQRAEAAAAAAAEGSAAAQPSSVDVSGVWLATNTDEYYEFQQFGSALAVVGGVPGYVALTGQGWVADDAVVFDYYLYDGSYGHAELRRVDENRLQGQMYNAVSGTTVGVDLERR